MSVSSGYRESWEGFWREAPHGQGGVFWDSEPMLTAGLHLAVYEPHLADFELPLLDLGCGNGTQTRFLTDRFTRVVGADLSPAALDRARSADPEGAAEYELLDCAEKAEVEELHGKLGDTNVYMRGVLHQCDADDRQAIVDGIATLIGQRGRAFLVELSQDARPILMGLAQSAEGPPPKLRPVLEHGIAPGEVADSAVPVYLGAAGLEVLASGELPLTTTEYTPEGTRIVLPSKWVVVAQQR
ncbi:class I SAM-dependent methyltransferase [Streptomyces sp. ADMS]|uniref:class I SAM-dependent methyltransferase n=1 Tax=Streptomyces sp. ADMS TaxID=3071415 RepID=UPI00296EC7CD|nr:class I SAM-dependent methyltransferase [Streptomyces sp. ADMS]MDW4905416.1 class I SAM-dependent methyltransferase [Streptomyces sp. ADMS]